MTKRIADMTPEQRERRAAYKVEWRIRNEERLKEKRAAEYWADPEGHRERSREYARQNRERLRAKAREHYWANPELSRAQRREYQQRNSGLTAERKRYDYERQRELPAPNLGRPWTAEDDAAVLSDRFVTDAHRAAALGRTVRAVVGRRYNLTKPGAADLARIRSDGRRERARKMPAPRRGQAWTLADDSIVMSDDYANDFERAQAMGRTVGSVLARRRHVKNPHLKEELRRKRADLNSTPAARRFAPWAPEEDADVLRQDRPDWQLARQMQRTPSSVTARRLRLRVAVDAAS